MAGVARLRPTVDPNTFLDLSRVAAHAKTPSQQEAVKRLATQMSRWVKTHADEKSPLPLTLEPVMTSLESPERTLESIQKTFSTIAQDPRLSSSINATLGHEASKQLRRQALALQELVGTIGEYQLCPHINPSLWRPEPRGLVRASASQVQQINEIEAVRTALMVTAEELEKTAKSADAKNYPGIVRYTKVIKRGLDTLDEMEEAIRGNTQPGPKIQERWERLRLSFLGEDENGFRSKWQRHLDFFEASLKKDPTNEGEPTKKPTDPILTAMKTRQDAYLIKKGELLAQEASAFGLVDTESPATDALKLYWQHRVAMELAPEEKTWRESVEAYYFLSGHMPTGSQSSSRFISFIGAFSAALGIEPLSWDGAAFPAIRRTWQTNGTLVMEPVYPSQKEGLSLRALFVGLIQTIQFTTALVDTKHLDPENGRNLDGIAPLWLETTMTAANVRVTVEGLQNVVGLRDKPLLLAGSHHGFYEYPLAVGLQEHFGPSTRILMDQKFLDNPIIRNLVGAAAKIYKFFFVERGAGNKAFEGMKAIGRGMLQNRVNGLVFPGASRPLTLVFEGTQTGILYRDRVEYVEYQSRSGIAITAETARDPHILPIAYKHSGELAPKSFWEMIHGIKTGTTMKVIVGEPFKAGSLRDPEREAKPAEQDPDFQRRVAGMVDVRFRNVSGLLTGPLYNRTHVRAKLFGMIPLPWKKTLYSIFQANTPSALKQAMELRLQKPATYRDSEVVLHPDSVYTPGEEKELITFLEKQNFPAGRRLTVRHSIRSSEGKYTFASYVIERNTDGSFKHEPLS